MLRCYHDIVPTRHRHRPRAIGMYIPACQPFFAQIHDLAVLALHDRRHEIGLLLHQYRQHVHAQFSRHRNHLRSYRLTDSVWYRQEQDSCPLPHRSPPPHAFRAVPPADPAR